jgi:hypothetical protein
MAEVGFIVFKVYLHNLCYYRYRMWIEERFGDLKGNGFDLQSTMLRHFSRFSRLTLALEKQIGISVARCNFNTMSKWVATDDCIIGTCRTMPNPTT